MTITDVAASSLPFFNNHLQTHVAIKSLKSMCKNRGDQKSIGARSRINHEAAADCFVELNSQNLFHKRINCNRLLVQTNQKTDWKPILKLGGVSLNRSRCETQCRAKKSIKWRELCFGRFNRTCRPFQTAMLQTSAKKESRDTSLIHE